MFILLLMLLILIDKHIFLIIRFDTDKKLIERLSLFKLLHFSVDFFCVHFLMEDIWIILTLMVQISVINNKKKMEDYKIIEIKTEENFYDDE